MKSGNEATISKEYKAPNIHISLTRQFSDCILEIHYLSALVLHFI